jgi:hypothetical protein
MAGQPAASQLTSVLLASAALVVFAPVTAWLYGKKR